MGNNTKGVIRSDIDLAVISELIETMIMGTVIMWIALPEKSLNERVETNVNEIWEHIKKIVLRAPNDYF